jgi:titin
VTNDTQTFNITFGETGAGSLTLGGLTSPDSIEITNTQTLDNQDRNIGPVRTVTYTYGAGEYGSSPGNFTGTITGLGSSTPLDKGFYVGGPATHSWSLAIPARPGAVPSEPTSVSSTPGNGSVSISFGAPSTNDPATTSYQYSTDNASWVGVPSNPFPVSGTNGTSLTVYVRALNAVGEGASASATSTPRTTPGALSFSAAPTNGNLLISYDAPGDNGGSAVTSYQYSTNGSTYTTTPSNPFYVNGPNGTAITVYVRAVNVAGAGVATSVTETPRTTPGAPTSMASTPANGSISVSFGAPSDNGGNAVSSYQYSTDNVTYATVPSNPFSVAGTNGTALTVYVRAINAAGPGSPGNTTSTPRTVPSAPQSFAGDNTTFGQITLSWSAPSSNGGNAVSSYVLRTGSTVLQNTSATSYVHTGLSPYTDYSYTVTAANAAGEGTAASLTVKTMGGVAKVWNDTAWVTVLPKVYNGTVWVEAQARMWDGSEWKHGI